MEKLIFFGLVIPILFFVLYLGTRAIMSGVSAKQANQANKDENEISFTKNSVDDFNLYREITEKNIPIDLLKKVIDARVNEIIDMSVTQNIYFKQLNSIEKPKIIFIGSGSKLLRNYNSLNLKKYMPF